MNDQNIYKHLNIIYKHKKENKNEVQTSDTSNNRKRIPKFPTNYSWNKQYNYRSRRMNALIHRLFYYLYQFKEQKIITYINVYSIQDQLIH